jgi:hypothetical protein
MSSYPQSVDRSMKSSMKSCEISVVSLSTTRYGAVGIPAFVKISKTFLRSQKIFYFEKSLMRKGGGSEISRYFSILEYGNPPE